MAKTVFIAHPLSGDIRGNAKKVLEICIRVHTADVIPVAPYLVSVQYLNDEVHEDRMLGIQANLEAFRRGYIDELWLFGDRITGGMWQEVELAWELRIPVIAKTEGTISMLAEREMELGHRMHRKHIFLICPVRGVTRETETAIRAYVQAREREGCVVHWPPRDTHQDDPVGVGICTQNGTAIHRADEVHVWYDPQSSGSHFDLGMYFMLARVLGKKKQFVIANPHEVPRTDGRKSFFNVLRALAGM